MRPIFTDEPWTQPVREAWATQDRQSRTTGVRETPPTYATTTFSRLNDGQYDSIAQLHQRRQAEEHEAALKTNRPPWDPTQWKYVPPSLRGLKPTTNEPWAEDEGRFGSSIVWYSEEFGGWGQLATGTTALDVANL